MTSACAKDFNQTHILHYVSPKFDHIWYSQSSRLEENFEENFDCFFFVLFETIQLIVFKWSSLVLFMFDDRYSILLSDYISHSMKYYLKS